MNPFSSKIGRKSPLTISVDLGIEPAHENFAAVDRVFRKIILRLIKQVKFASDKRAFHSALDLRTFYVVIVQ